MNEPTKPALDAPVVVFGATGLLGSRVVNRLLDRGMPVRAATRAAIKARALGDSGADVIEADLMNAASVQAALTGVRAVISTANGFMTSRRTESAVDFVGNNRLIDACESANVRRIVFVSAAPARNDSPVDFFRWKGAIEGRLRSSTLDYTIIHPGQFMEIWGGMIADGIERNGKAVVLGRSDRRANYVAVDDVADCIASAIDDPSTYRRTLPIIGPAELTPLEIVRTSEEVMGKRAIVRRIPRTMLTILGHALSAVNPVMSRMMKAAVLTADDVPPSDALPARVGVTTIRQVLERRNNG